MGTLNAALAWAARGFPVFPLLPNSKTPITDAWQHTATTDPETIRRLWLDPVLKNERNYNIGCLCNDMVVVDVDVKDGKDGYNEYAQLQGHYDTLVVRTPTGGFHCYFMGPDSTNAPVASAVDIRSHNGYVVAPGSTIDGQTYTVANDRDLAWIPLSIERMLRAPYVRSEVEYAGALDSQASIEAGRRYLESAPVAVQGQRGDETTFVTAARLCREMALSVPAAFALMRDHWNARCEPPWEPDELLRKVENAAAYGSAEMGGLTPQVLFASVPEIEAPPTVFEQEPGLWGNAVLPYRIPPRPWLVDRALMTGAVTLLLAAGSAGKSSISLALAAHLAHGLDFAGFKAHQTVKTMIYNGEDDILEQSRRLLAVCILYGFDYDETKKHIMLLSPRQIKMDLVDLDQYRKPIRNQVLVDHIIKEASHSNVGLLILDPLVKVHKCDESDNGQMDFVMETITDIAYQARIAVLALHHTAKSTTRTEDRIGNMDTSRGASAIVNAARIAFTLFNASQQDAEDYGFPDNERHMWVRMDDAKMNMSLATDNAAWFLKQGVKLHNGDIVGVTRYEALEKSMHHIRFRIGRCLIATLQANNAGSLLMTQAVAVVKAGEPLWANKTDTEVRRKLEGMFASEVKIDGNTLKITRDVTDKKSDKVYITVT